MHCKTCRRLIPLLALLAVCSITGAHAARAEEPAPAPKAAGKEVTLSGMLGCGKCSFHQAKACENVLKVKTADGKEDSYLLADNDVSKANHEKVCGPASPATVTGVVSKKGPRRVLTATAIKFD